jgi:cytochrome c-type biogenesis protein CcmH
MKNVFLGCVLGLLCVVAIQAKEAVPLAEDPVIEQRLITISEEMRCLVCQNESLAGSRAELAQDLRRELRELIKDGKSDAEIKEFMVSRYGDFVLYRPPVKPSTWGLWLGPFALVLIGLFFLIRYLKRRNSEINSQPLSREQLDRVQSIIRDSAND